MRVALNVSASGNRAILFLTPAANSVFPVLLILLILLIILIFQILFRIHLVSVIKCYWARPTE